MRFRFKPSPAQIIVSTTLSTTLSLLHSVRTRGARRTAVFAGLGLLLPTTAEYLGVNVARALRHHTQPQLLGVPLAAALGWYNITYPTFAVVERLIQVLGVPRSQRHLALPIGTALVATSLDLVLDCYGLDEGLWEWSDDGVYATELKGPNGKQGIPAANFIGWLVLTSSITSGYLALTENHAGHVIVNTGTGRAAALMLLPYYGIGVAWALFRGKPRYLMPSALVPLVIGIVLMYDRERA